MCYNLGTKTWRFFFTPQIIEPECLHIQKAKFPPESDSAEADVHLLSCHVGMYIVQYTYLSITKDYLHFKTKLISVLKLLLMTKRRLMKQEHHNYSSSTKVQDQAA